MVVQLESKLSDEQSQKAAVQGELDDLLMVFEDVEDKVSRYRVIASCNSLLNLLTGSTEET